MRRWMMLAPVLALAVSGANCAGDSASSSSPTGPSSVVSDSTTAGKGSGGGGGRKGGGGTTGGGSLALVMVTDKNGDGLPNWGDTVTFNVSTSATSSPTVTLLCSQNGQDVYGATSGFYDSYPWPWTKNMALWSGAWTSGAASCTATLHPLSDSGTVLARLSFTAGA